MIAQAFSRKKLGNEIRSLAGGGREKRETSGPVLTTRETVPARLDKLKFL